LEDFMQNTIAALVVVSLAVAAQPSVPKGFENIQGTWIVTSVPGTPLPSGAHAAFVVTGDKYQGFENGKPNERGTITLGLAAKPITIDLAVTEGTTAGKTQLGLLEVTGDTARLALAEPGSPSRPTTFDGSGALTLTRVTPLAKELVGSWEGTVTLGAQPLRIVLKLANGTDGLATGVLVSPDQSAQEVPIAAIVRIGSRVRALIPAIRATFEGEL
jgi:uncharacterized protein (TIGR03067 family)